MFLSLFIVCMWGGWRDRGHLDIFFTPATFRRYQFSRRRYQFFWQLTTLVRMPQVTAAAKLVCEHFKVMMEAVKPGEYSKTHNTGQLMS